MLYHINSKGEIDICHADKILCPLGTDHYNSVEEALRGIANDVNHHILPKPLSAKPKALNGENIKLDTFMDIELMNDMIQQGFISSYSHPDDDSLKVLCYTSYAQIAGKWNEATKQARGLIIQSSSEDLSDAVLVQRPWRKFFTLSQINSGWALGDEENSTSAESLLKTLDFSAPAEVTDKVDGSMGILYRDPHGDLALSTKGSFSSDQAIYFTKLLRSNEKFSEAAESLFKENQDTTFLYEMVSPKNRIVLKYDTDDLILLGAVRKKDGLYRSTSDFSRNWKDKGLRSAEFMPANSLTEAFNLPHRDKREGVVVRLKTDDPNKQMQIKIKQEDYLKMHKLMTNFSKKMARNYVQESRLTYGQLLKVAKTGDINSLHSIVSRFPEKTDDSQFNEIRQIKINEISSAVIPEARRILKAKEYIDSLPESYFSGDPKKSMKNFVINMPKTEKEDKGLILSFFRARLTKKPLDRIVASKSIKNIQNLI
jgi:RNA ligase